MRALATFLAASVFATGCLSSSYRVTGDEIQRLAMLPPEARGQHVRVVQQLQDSDVGPAQPVTHETQIVLIPTIEVDDGRRRGGGGWSGGGGWGSGNRGGGSWSGGASGGGASGGHGGNGGHIKTGGGSVSGGGGDGKGAAIAILIGAAVILVAAAAIEGSRFDGYAELHPMHPVHLIGKDGSEAVMPLAWIDPQSAAFTDHAVLRSGEGPWRELEHAPLSREGFTYSMYAGVGTFESADGNKARGTATTIQFGYFPEQRFGLVGSMFFGWRDNRVAQTLFESRYTAELQAFPIASGAFHFGLYGGGGGAYRFEDGIAGGNSGSLALLGGAMVQLDINTRLALTARLGETYAHSEHMTDALFGLSVY
jgi:hypothetical protein